MSGQSLAEVLSAAVAHHGAGRLDAAEQHYTAILEQVPDQLDALHLLGVLTLQRATAVAVPAIARLTAGIDLIRRAHDQPASSGVPDIAANLARGLAALAEAHTKAGAPDRALEAWLEADGRGLPLTPANRLALAESLATAGAVAEAEGQYRALLEAAPVDLGVRTGLARLLVRRGRVAEALALLDGLPPPDAANAAAHRLRAQLLIPHAPDLAAGLLDTVAAAVAMDATHHHLLGRLRQARGDVAGARDHHARALALESAHAAARLAHAEACLRLGAWRDGFADLAWRWMQPATTRRFGGIPLWERADQDIAGRRLLVWDEADGAALPHLARLLPALRDLGADVRVEVPPGWAALLPTGPGQALAGIAVATRGRDEAAGDLQIPLQELPDRLELWDGAAFWTGPYLAAPADVRAPTPPEGRRIGVAAHGPLPPLPPGATAVPLALPGADAPEGWAALAATLAALDAVALPAGLLAHVAGGLGRAGVVLVPPDADWRWPAAGLEATPWYPAFRLAHGDAWPDWTAAALAETPP
ncbi:MAG: tetratricopeptide repeat protein [Azospirillaceae bacterium]|nr:tetratricopeptide repeat protein [Azospirillaceae bacterium]